MTEISCYGCIDKPYTVYLRSRMSAVLHSSILLTVRNYSGTINLNRLYVILDSPLAIIHLLQHTPPLILWTGSLY